MLSPQSGRKREKAGAVLDAIQDRAAKYLVRRAPVTSTFTSTSFSFVTVSTTIPTTTTVYAGNVQLLTSTVVFNITTDVTVTETVKLDIATSAVILPGSNTTSPPPSSPPGGLSDGSKAGIGAGVGVGGAAALGALAFLLLRRRKKVAQDVT